MVLAATVGRRVNYRSYSQLRSATPRSVTAMVSSSNSFLASSTSQFPLWASMKAEEVVPAMTTLLDKFEEDLATLEASVAVPSPESPSFEKVVGGAERLGDALGRVWGMVNHLKGCKDSEELRKAHEEVQPRVVEVSQRAKASEKLYAAFKRLREDEALWSKMTEAQQRTVDKEVKDAELSGVGLTGAEKERFVEIQSEMSKLSTEFSNHLLDSTKAFKELITEKEGVDGLPATSLELAANTAKGNGHEGATSESGPWMFTLDAPSYVGVMQHAKDRDLREKVYRAYLTRASEGKVNNEPLVNRILSLRKEKAALLGYANHGEVSMATKMATLESAHKLLEDVRAKSWDAAVGDLEEVKEFAKSQGLEGELKHWDVSFYAERLRENKFDLKDEELRPYFQLPSVIDGMFALASKLFGVSIAAVDGESEVWHKDVRFFKVSSIETGEPVAYFYLDPYSRPEEKRGGAWMDEVTVRSRILGGDSVRLPIAHMVCNGTPPSGEKPSLMTHREVETLFHEFGHALQHMLTRQEISMVSGINGVEWDAVELPSQFMENWCYHKPTVKSFAKHYETGEALPDSMFEKLVAARTFRAGSMMLRQVHFAKTDLELHTNFVPNTDKSIFDVDREVAKTTMVMAPLEEDRFLCGFGHIFAGGYSAGYYSYKWAEVLSADSFGAFEEAGLDDEEAVKKTGKKFRDTVLAQGGGREPLKVFVDFRGRPPNADALLRHNGLLQAA